MFDHKIEIEEILSNLADAETPEAVHYYLTQLEEETREFNTTIKE